MSLDNNSIDRSVALGKGLAALVPAVGGLIGEAVGQMIPAQRLDRVIDFLRKLDAKLGVLDDALKRERVIRDLDLLEAAVLHATRATSDERRERIACLVANSLTAQQVDLLREKKLLDLVSELNDAELLTLRSYGLGHGPEAMAFYDKHQAVLQVKSAYLGGGSELVDGEAIHYAYREQLARLHLIKPNFRAPRKGELPDLDPNTGMLKSSENEITWLGRMVLNSIDLPDDLRAREQQADAGS